MPVAHVTGGVLQNARAHTARPVYLVADRREVHTGDVLMDVGVIGLGRMGGNMAARLLDAGHRLLAGLRRQFGGHAVRPPENGPA